MKILKWCGMLLLDGILSYTLTNSFIVRQERSALPDAAAAAWSNVIPGWHDTIPLLLRMKKGPWPLPKQQNCTAVAQIDLSGEEPVLLKGRINRVRYWNFVFYPENAKFHSAALPKLDGKDVVSNPDSTYTITISAVATGKNILNTGGALRGMLAMRNYVPQPRTKIILPAIFYGKEKRVSEEGYVYE